MFKKESKTKSQDTKLPTSFTQPMTAVMPNKQSNSTKGGTRTTLVAQDTEVFGDIKFSGLLEIEGTIVGNISANPSAEAHVRIQESGRVEGDIHVSRVVINGNVKGTVLSSTLELASKAMVEGNVHYSTIEMMKGSQVNGSLVHEENALSSSSQVSLSSNNQKKIQKVPVTSE